MLTLKRVYLYAVLGIALAVLLVGLNDVVRVAFDRAGDILASRSYVSEDTRTELSWALALAIVSAPVFLVHLLLIRRTLRGPEETVADERASAARATYFFLVLVVTGAIAAMRLVELAEILIASIAFGHRAWELAAAAAGALVIGAAWAAHVWARRHDLRAAADTFASACTHALLAATAVGAVPSYLDLCPSAVPSARPRATPPK